MSGNTLRHSDLRLLDDLFDMGGGYVLDFSNQTFADFFTDELGVDIYSTRWESVGTSKAKRLRYYLRSNSPSVVVKTLLALWDYRESERRRAGREETVLDAEEQFYSVIERLGGSRPQSQTSDTSAPYFKTLNPSTALSLKAQLLSISQLDPQPRGYAYEAFLKALFDAHGLGGRAGFRLEGEQIDGSFELAGEVYLLEAKWTASKTAAADLRSFNAKVQDKSTWSRGLFVSDSGFTEQGLHAFGRGNSVICMDGLDLFDILDLNLSFSEVLRLKVRRAAETGNPFVRARDLGMS